MLFGDTQVGQFLRKIMAAESAAKKKTSGIDIVKVAEELYRPREKTAMQRFIDRQTRRILPPLIKAASGVLTPSVPSFNRDDRSWGQAGLETGAALGAGYGLDNLSRRWFNPTNPKLKPIVSYTKGVTPDYIQSRASKTHTSPQNIYDTLISKNHVQPRPENMMQYRDAMNIAEKYLKGKGVQLERWHLGKQGVPYNPSLFGLAWSNKYRYNPANGHLTQATIHSNLADYGTIMHEAGHAANMDTIAKWLGNRKGPTALTGASMTRLGIKNNLPSPSLIDDYGNYRKFTYRVSGLPTFNTNIPTYLKNIRSPRSIPGLGILAASAFLPRDNAVSKFVSDNAYLAPWAMAAPQLIEEGTASVRGFNALRKARGMRVAGRSLPGLLAAFGTYAAAPIGLSAAAYLANRLRPNQK